MGVRGLLFFVVGVVLLYICIPSVVGHGGQSLSGYAGYGRDGGRSYGYGRGYGYGYGRWWCTCRWWCRYSEWRVRNTCAIPFYPYWMKTCCKWLPWYKTNGYGFGGYRGYGTSDNGLGYSPAGSRPDYSARPYDGSDISGFAGYGSPDGGAKAI